MKKLTAASPAGAGLSACVISAAFIVVAFALAFQRLPSADLWWHLAGGRYILENGLIPRTDPFSYTAFGQPWMNHEWLSQVIFYLVFRLGGLSLLVGFKSLIITLTAWVVFRLGWKVSGSPVLAALVTFLSLLCARTTPFFDVRPYIFSYLFSAIFLSCLERFSREKKSFFVFLLIPLTILWANLHAAFPLGLALAAIYLVAALLRGDWAGVRVLSAVLLGATLASGLTPYGFQPLLYPLSFLKADTFRAALSDWTPPDLLGRESAFGIFLCLELLFVLFSLKTLRAEEALILGLMGLLGMSAVRHVFLACLLSAPILAGLLGPFWRRARERFPLRRADTPLWGAVIFLAIAGGAFIIRDTDWEGMLMERQLFPVEAVGFLNANPLPGRLFAPYEWGGYLIWKLYPKQKVFIDGRASSLYPEKIYRDALSAMWGDPGWKRILNEYHIGFVLCNKWQVGRGMLLPWRLIHDPSEWQLVHSDDIAMLFARISPENGRFLRDFREGRFRYPPSPRLIFQEGMVKVKAGWLREAEERFKETLRLDSRYAPAWVALGYVQAVGGKNREAVLSFKRALKLDPEAASAHYNLGLILQKEGRKKQARREFEKEIRLNPDFKAAQEALRELTAP